MKRNLTIAAFLLIGLMGSAWAWNEPRLFDHFLRDDEGATESPLDSEEVSPEITKLNVKGRRPWMKPDYSGQEAALGWTPETFTVPEGLRDRVNFWIDIYTKYTTDQGIIHDSEHVSVIYSTIDFSDIESDQQLTERAKRRARQRRVKDKKREIKTRLQRLAKVKQPSEGLPEGLDEEDRRIWQMFATIDERDKFQRATRRKRIRFQLGQRDRSIQGIYYAGRYLPEMEHIFREAGLPIELTRLPFVESSFNVKARSRVGASGIWQFMRYTGRRFMRINYAVDERNDPITATRAAAKFMRMNFEMLEKWPLAITAYNHGAAGVQRMVRRYKTDDIVQLADERFGRFKFASANFYATFLAALEVERNAERYFGKVVWDVPLKSKELRIAEGRLDKSLLMNWFEGDMEKARDWNPHLSAHFWRGHTRLRTKDFVRVPEEKYELALEDMKKRPRTIASSDEEDLNVYLISRGQTLSEIALELGVPVRAILEINDIDNPRRIRAGQKLLVPKGH